jgi:hypothetical protein
MLRQMRAARVDLKTGILILALALIVWGIVAYVRIRDFIPPELSEPSSAPPPPAP